MIKCSAGTAKVLGIKELKTDALPTTAYLMAGERCSNDCSFCPQARSSSARSDLLSRVTWPSYEPETVLAGVARAFQTELLERACFQVVNSSEAMVEMHWFVDQLRVKSAIPVCVSCAVGSLEGVARLLEQGADHVSIALDAGCERIYATHKGGVWEHKITLLSAAAMAFPGKIATHLIVGLGESEAEMLATIQTMLDMGVIVALFAFTPVRGTKLEKSAPPAIGHYRRIQAAAYLMRLGLIRYEVMSFHAGELIDFGIPAEEWYAALAEGEAFRTSGCPGCNRPYYNEKPGGVMYNYPVPLTVKQAEQAMAELGMVEVGQEGD
ncbi:MAG: radical SAM protein [Peptococcaceae bacterium]|nr:radical SAM protein [Peptococcaceae bacterium]